VALPPAGHPDRDGGRPVTTALRALGPPGPDGCHVLTASEGTFVDGSEETIRQVLAAATDLTSSSDELTALARTWPERYHLDGARANVLRPLTWDPTWSVLEVGAGCGAITRFLGEQCRLVDALEPVRARARAARLRTRDLEGVEIFVATIDDVPDQAVYDAVVVVGVLEYVGRGDRDPGPYVAFLRRLAGLLRPGGTLALAIENRLGVKYLCGAPEDHTGRPFESLEGYYPDAVARTFSRVELEGLFRQAGLHPRVLGAFPDYKLTHCVLADALIDDVPSLARRIPRFPSPDWMGSDGRLANEALAWGTLVEAGLGRQVPNSFLVLATPQPEDPVPWADGQLAAYYSPASWRSEFAIETRVCRDHGAVTFTRHRLLDGPDERWSTGPTPMAEGRDLVEALAGAPDDEAVSVLLDRWLEALDREIERGRLPAIDLLPHNAVIGADGSIVFVDAKWDRPGVSRNQVVARAAILTAPQLALLSRPERWPAATVGELARHLGTLAGLPASAEWLAPALDLEADFQAGLVVGRADRSETVRIMRHELEQRVATSLSACAAVVPVGGRLQALSEAARSAEARAAEAERAAAEAQSAEARAVAEARAAEADRSATEARAAEAERAAAEAKDRLTALENTKVIRHTAGLRRLYGRGRDRLGPAGKN